MRSRRRRIIVGIGGLVLVVVPIMAGAQLLPSLPGPVGGTLGGVLDRAQRTLPLDESLADVRELARAQVERVRDLVRRYPDRIEVDRDGNAVRAGEVTLIDPDAAALAKAQALGFRLIEDMRLDDLGIGFARLRVPAGLSAADAAPRLARAVGKDRVATDPLHFASGAGARVARAAPAVPPVPAGARIGIVDGGVADSAATQRGFATGAPHADDHAAGIASLLGGGGGIRASAPGARLYVADVFGTDPAGGSATAIARALAWMVREQVPVVVVSLAGPANPLLARVVAAARTRGTFVVAAVGNDGPAAPPAYPASYPTAIAVTGVDARGRALGEAGRAAHLDYAAPGADMLALDARGQPRRVRGTSFAAPLVAARLAAALAEGPPDRALGRLDAEAKKGAPRTGRGILCGNCRTPAAK